MIINNLSEFKNALSDMGFGDVDMSFASNGENQKDTQEQEFVNINDILEEDIEENRESLDLKIPLYL
jgi:hypothetical protein